ncbi:hypothetical protein UA45_15445 [Morganella morganii]|uniref:Uncharacterized protein n=1 Tax=Morganella morganii TaxID=582 RepID=A0A0D8L5C6_MORMO|nr:hypothetical protein UA45_15445 [Morganella morganii]
MVFVNNYHRGVCILLCCSQSGTVNLISDNLNPLSFMAVRLSAGYPGNATDSGIFSGKNTEL